MSEQQQTRPFPPSNPFTNTRRVPASRSVTLRRSSSPSPPIRIDKNDKVDRIDEKSVAGLSQASNIAAASEGNHNASRKQTAAPEGGNAEDWFEESNKNTLGKGNVRFVNHDLPFYLPRDRSSNETDTNQNSGSGSKPSPEDPAVQTGDEAIPYSNESYSDDYRSIIDDLTIENRELKQRLKKYELMYSSHLQENKLFEVYIHQLSPTKKRKLEGMLREFASGVGPIDSQPYAHLSAPNLAQQNQPSALKHSGSSHSTGKPQDSGYASMSVSGGGASNQSHSHREPLRPAQLIQNTNQRVRSYVQDLPTALLPKGSIFMSEKSKRKIVVQKLEQLFIGRGDTSTKQGQPQQQQEVSQLAANAERQEHEARGRHIPAEGFREAKIKNELRRSKRRRAALLSSASTGGSSSSGGGQSSSSSADQRPTRPLDLDPTRAQDPKETIQYMKHLGFDSPQLDSDVLQEEGRGWIYLNLLMNMAQLHTLNVTPAFVRDALQAYSNNFEMSEDGRSIRWKGGAEPTDISMDSIYGQEDQQEILSPDSKRETPQHKSIKTPVTSKPTPQPVQRQGPRPLKPNGLNSLGGGWRIDRERNDDSRYYSPMFYHGNESDPYNEMSGSVPLYESVDKSRTISSDSNIQTGSRQSRKPAKSKDMGTMIFYTGAKFYTDLSGDPFCMPSTISYDRFDEQIMGTPSIPTSPYESRGMLSTPSLTPSMIDAFRGSDIGDISGIVDLDMSDPKDTGERDLIELSATGIGGVTPEDNFLIDVLIKFEEEEQEIIKTHKTDLKKSSLPPPSYAFLQFSSSSSDYEESEDEEDFDEYATADILPSGIDEKAYVPPTFLNVYSSESTRRTTSQEEDDSIDMLEYARRADPQNVAAREKEFEEIQSVGPADAAPPGSIAATVGDVSNFFTSQEDGASYDGRMLKRQQSEVKDKMTGKSKLQPKPKTGIKRTGDSLASPKKRQEV